MEIQIKIEIDAEVPSEVAEAYMDSVLEQIRRGVIKREWGAPRLSAQLTFPPIKAIPQWPSARKGRD